MPTEGMAADFLRLILLVDGPQEALARIEAGWERALAPLAVDSLAINGGDPSLDKLYALLAEEAGEDLGQDINEWYRWLWNQEITPHPDYAEFKAELYGRIDPRFRGYFNRKRTAHIRLDEVRWGGVRQDGIPPLRSPTMIPATEAEDLEDGDVVFGIEVNDDARAFPKRILAWHELFTDEVGGEPVAGVYCTLCGSMILYRTESYQLGTSGFLYRSNKLMYDQATQSLWSTLEGRPVIGPLADQDIQLQRLGVVTTTWGEWRRRHPDTTVLSFDTGHQRDYREGVAYREYFATDELMFGVPRPDARLKNKHEVLGLTFPEQSDHVLALSTDFLSRHPVHHDRLANESFVVLTDPSGASRVYRDGGIRFVRWDGDQTAWDDQENVWTLHEDRLESGKQNLARLPAHQAFWFGWVAAYPETRLVK